MIFTVPTHLGYGVLAGLIAGESAGLPIPGETALISAALLAGSGALSLPVVIAVATIAAIVGDNFGYWTGRRAGRRALLAERGPFRRHRTHLLAKGEVSSPATARRPSPSGVSSRVCASPRQLSQGRQGCAHARFSSRTPSVPSPGRPPRPCWLSCSAPRAR